MRKLGPALLAITLALVLAAPALAGGSQQGMVTKTFKLTLYGNVPATKGFALSYLTSPQPQRPNLIVFCGQAKGGLPPVKVVDPGPCKGNGTTYTVTMQFKQGTTLFYGYVVALLSDPNTTSQIFAGNLTGNGRNIHPAGGPEILTSNITNSAWYSFGGNGQTPRMPDAGAGGASRPGLPLALLPLALLGLAGMRRLSKA